MLGLMMLIVAIGVTAGTAAQASQKGGLYILYIGKMRDISSTTRLVPNYGNYIISFEGSKYKRFPYFRTVHHYDCFVATRNVLSHNEGEPCRWSGITRILR